MNQVWPIFKREFAAYFATPLAYVFIVIFLFAMGAFTFYIGHFYENGVADLSVFFAYHPWLYLFLVPAISMRLWAEERRTGTMELLLTLARAALGDGAGQISRRLGVHRRGAGAHLPDLDHGELSRPSRQWRDPGELYRQLPDGGRLSRHRLCISATTNNQVIAFVVSVVVCFLFTISGAPLVLDFFRGWAPLALVNAVASFSFLTHFTAISRA
jgi:ABC-2 type transport system permease protein